MECVFTRRRVYDRNRPQPFAAVRNRSQRFLRGRYGRVYGKFCHFWGFTCRVASFRVAGVALRVS